MSLQGNTTLPGRFPSPTPSIQSTFTRTENESTPTCPSGLEDRPPFDIDNCGRPQIPSTQNEAIVSWERRTLQQLPNPHTPIGIRPQRQQRPVSDTRYDRRRSPLLQQHASASRVVRSRRRPGSNISPFHRPSTILEGQAASTTEPPPKFWSPQLVNEGLRSKIRKKMEHNDTLGVVYILRDRSWPHHLKIGSTKNLSERVKNLERKCDIKVDIVHSSDDLKNYLRAEQLARADLRHLMRAYTCPGCATFHTEWHEVDYELARRTVDRWVAFLQQQPYNGNGLLKSLWEYVLSKRRAEVVADDLHNHDTRWQHWADLLAPPSVLDLCGYVFASLFAHPFWSHTWKYSWQVSCIIAWLLLYLVLWNKYVFGCFVTHVACSYMSIWTGRKAKV